MLKSLEIENIAVIEKVSINFDSGFNVLTGETGAGKSIIIDSINAVLGLRTSRDLVRTGASYARVFAEFSPVSDAVKDFLYKLDIELGPDNLILQRRISADSNSSCRINGKPVTASTMRELGELLVNIHGQHDSQKLLDSERHYLYLDQMLPDRGIIDDYSSSYSELVKTVKELKSLSVDEDQKQRRIEQLKYEIDEIEKADIKPGEKEELLKRKELINSLSTLLEALNTVKLNISGDDESPGALGLVSGSLNSIMSVKRDELEDISSLLLSSEEALVSCLESVQRKLDEYDIDPNSIDEIENRLSVYYEFSNRYGKSEEEILDYLSKAKKELKSINFADERRAALEEEFEIKKEETYKKALLLSDLRKETAIDFEKRIESELEFLNMPSAKFKVEFVDGPISKNGIDNIQFLISVNAGENLKPLEQVASGGELSRIMLAFRSVLGEKEAVPTLIFDEIDTGVSGRAAGKVGLKLNEVSNNAQVICVTHLAQIAAIASTHYLIYKQVVDGRTYTNVKKLDFDGRQYEIARIMGGMNINELMLENAKELLKEFNDDNL